MNELLDLNGNIKQKTWTKFENHIIYAKWLGDKLGFTEPEYWYNVSGNDFDRNHGGGLLNYYDSSPIKFLKKVYPNYEWLDFKLGRTPTNYWKDIGNHKKYAEWLGNKLEYTEKEHWYNISTKDFENNYGTGLLNYYNRSPIKFVTKIYPDYEWLEWRFNKTPQNYWKDIQNHKKYAEWLGKHLGYKQKEDWYNVTQDIILKNNGVQCLSKYNNSPTQFLRTIYPDYEWLEWKFTQTSKNFWNDIENHKKYTEWLGNKLGYTEKEHWYNITYNIIAEHHGGGVLSKYNSSPIQFLKTIYPDYEWLEWKFGMASPGTWTDINNHKKYAEWLRNILGYTEPEQWYNISKSDFDNNSGGGLLSVCYNSSPIKFVMDMYYPEYEWLEWKFTSVSNGYWEETEHHKKYAIWLGIVLGYKDKNDWYSVTCLHIINNCGGTLLGNYYNNSPQQFLRAIFPECEWQEWKFIQTSKKFWADVNNRINYATRLGEILGYTEPEHWYKISRSMIGYNGGHGVLNYCKSYTEIPKMLYPEYDWIETKFWNYKTETKLYERLLPIYPMIIAQFKQDWCMKTTYLKFDFCIPEHNIIIELDGPQHFIQVSNWSSPEEQFENDKYKEKCANDNNYSVIRILQEDVLFNKYDWIKDLCDAIEEIKNGDEIVNIYLCKNGEYDKF